MICLSQFGSKDRLHEALEVFGHFVIDVETGIFGSLQLLLINVSIGVADDGGQSVVRYIDTLRQRNHLRAKLGHASLHGLLHGAV